MNKKLKNFIFTLKDLMATVECLKGIQQETEIITHFNMITYDCLDLDTK